MECAIEQGIEEETISSNDITQIKGLLEKTTTIIDNMKGIIQDSIGQCTMSSNHIDKTKILEEDKEIGNFLAKMWNT
jgi:hypothetical protein